MSIPLFSDKRNKGTVVAAMAERNEVEYKRQAALLRLHTQLFEAYSQRHQHIDAIKVYQNTVLPELSAALTSTQRAYENGRYSYQDWIAAQQALLRAKQALIESAASAALNQVLIEKLTGEQLTSEQQVR
jgi:cobalt-zinc-cadmium efflux system outer membrane protein